MPRDHLEKKTEAELVLVLLGDFVHNSSGAHMGMVEASSWNQIWDFCPEKQLSVNHFRKIPFFIC